MPTTATAKADLIDLIIDWPGSAGMRVHLEHGHYRLGRSSVNELAFPEDQKLSREHLVFERTGDGWTVRDVGSRNGTQVNGTTLIGTACLSHGDRIMAGRLSIRYDTRREFADAGLNEITFVEQPLEGSAATVSVDLKAALETSTDMAGRPTLENDHLGALVRAGRTWSPREAL
jgi:FHA domain-containing protein